ncbi:AI-2E family transporter [Georgenia sp. 10Sc9-8]|uniref:AI-2E family transporter n=1 Tax=Georgenia halotolerans TaxID=3028317 RepID=A0ABT5TYU0_9MICO|nr:AI-2E family transporter [Georgenia halotolerans]
MTETKSTWRSLLDRSRSGPAEHGALQLDRGSRAAGAAQRRGPEGPVPPSVRAAAEWAWRLLVLAAVVVVVSYVVITFKMVVVAFIIAILLAVLLEPIASFLRRRARFNRTLAALTTIVLALGLVGGALALAGNSIVQGFGALAGQVSEGFDQALAWFSDGPLEVSETQLDQWVSQATGQIQDNASSLAGGVLAATSTVGQVVTGGVIALFCLFFFLREGRAIWRWFVRLAPVRAREPMNEAGIRGWITMGSYVRTQIIVALVDSVGIGIGAVLLGVPLALPIAILVFLGAFIPIVGALVTGAVAVLVALVDQGFVTALLMLGIVLLVQQLEGNVFQPWLQGNALSLHPIAIVLAVTAGAMLAGILGALLSVPLVAVVNVVVLYLHGHDKFPRLQTDWNRPGGPPRGLHDAIEESFPHPEEDEEDEPDRLEAARRAMVEAEQEAQRARDRAELARQEMSRLRGESGPRVQEPGEGISGLGPGDGGPGPGGTR